MILKLYSSGMTDVQIQEIVDSLYSYKYSTSTISVITDAVKEDVAKLKLVKLKNAISLFLPMRSIFLCEEIQLTRKLFLSF